MINVLRNALRSKMQDTKPERKWERVMLVETYLPGVGLIGLLK